MRGRVFSFGDRTFSLRWKEGVRGIFWFRFVKWGRNICFVGVLMGLFVWEREEVVC